MITFKPFLDEMTMRAGNLSPALKKTFDYFLKYVKDDELTHIGDLDSIKVMRFEKSAHRGHGPAVPQVIDFLVKGDQRVGMMLGDLRKVNDKSPLWNKVKYMLEVKEWYIIDEHQRARLGEKYLYFLKNVLKTTVLLSDVHSTATVEFLKKQAAGDLFKLSWYNLSTGELRKFDDSKYSAAGPTGWQVLVEADEISTLSRFQGEVPRLICTYEWLL